jgi:hypothetical protein
VFVSVTTSRPVSVKLTKRYFVLYNPHSAEGLTEKGNEGEVRKNGAEEEYQNERLDHLGIVAGVCREIGLVEWIDRQAGPRRNLVNIGTATMARVLNGLGESLR